VLSWSRYVALGDSLTAGRDDHEPGGARVGWARRLAGILTARTAVPCALTNLAADGADVTAVLEWQLPSVARFGPDLVSVTVGMNDIRDPGFSQDRFAAELCLDAWSMPAAADPGLFGPDRIHPNAGGHQLLAAACADLLLAG